MSSLKFDPFETKWGEFTVRPARVEDVGEVTRLIQKAFAYWRTIGYPVLPEKQSESTTLNHLVGKGLVAITDEGRIVATVSVDVGKIVPQGESVWYLEGASEKVEYGTTFPENVSPIQEGPYLVFKKLAVDPEFQKQHLGSMLYSFVEEFAIKGKFVGMVLETAREANWLYSWYANMGFVEVGGHHFEGSSLTTRLLYKNFGEKND